MHKSRDRLTLLAFLAVVLAAWMVFFLLPGPRSAALPPGNDLGGLELSDTVYTGAGGWESWPNHLYTPTDFEQGWVDEAPVSLTPADYRTVQYVTHRLTLTLPMGQLLAIHMRTSGYAMRLYIDGVELGSVGTPSNAWETTVPRVLDKTYLFTPAGETVTLLVHAANFVHGRDGCRPPAFTLGSPQSIDRLTTRRAASSFAVASCLLTAGLYHLGLFLLGRGQKNALYLSVCCTLLIFTSKTLLFTFFPDYSFFFWFRAAYLVQLAVLLTLTLFLGALFPGLYHRWMMRGFYGVVAAYALLVICADTVFFTGLLGGFQLAAAAVMLYTLARLAWLLRGGSIQNLLALLGALAICLPGLWDIAQSHGLNVGSRALGQFTPLGVILFVLCYAMVISLKYAEAERREQHLAADNASLDRLNQLKTDLMVTISHEARTPLAVLSSYAGLVSMQLRDKGVEPQIAADLDKVVFEAKRVANLIDSMGKLALPGGDGLRRVPLDISDVARQTAELYRHILERAGVDLTLDAESPLPAVLGSPEELTQVLLNLLQNARAATERGRVTITIGHGGGRVAVTVSDTGTGIAPEALERVFVRGFSLSGGLGIGLPLCKEIVEDHGGAITIESAYGMGTAVTFTLPVC